jgi:hypothetical protein
VGALPLADGINVGGHYLRYFIPIFFFKKIKFGPLPPLGAIYSFVLGIFKKILEGGQLEF